MREFLPRLSDQTFRTTMTRIYKKLNKTMTFTDKD